MKIPDFANFTKKLIAFIPTRNIEKIAFRILLGVWLLIILVVIILGTILSASDDIEKRIKETATNVTFPAIEESEIERYESLLNLAKYPEGIDEYIQKIKHDPFSAYKEELHVATRGPSEYNFILKAIDKIELPLVYKGYIELPDQIIGQINWRGSTKFVTVASTLNGYRIRDISKKKIDAIDEKGKNIEFKLNQPVFGDELQATLYDDVSKENFDVYIQSKIGDYEVVKITPDYVVLESESEEIKLEREP